MKDKKVLIVEDEVVVALELEERLKEMGYSVCGITFSGEKAISLAGEANPNLILMDIKLKGKMNGIEAADTIKEKFTIPSIFVTAFSDENTIQQIKSSANNEYLIKPFEEDELKGAIERVVGTT